MLPELEKLAEDIATIRGLCVELEGSDAMLVTNQIVRHLEWMLLELAQRDELLTGEMPWWAEWQRRPDDSEQPVRSPPDRGKA